MSAASIRLSFRQVAAVFCLLVCVPAANAADSCEDPHKPEKSGAGFKHVNVGFRLDSTGFRHVETNVDGWGFIGNNPKTPNLQGQDVIVRFTRENVFAKKAEDQLVHGEVRGTVVRQTEGYLDIVNSDGVTTEFTSGSLQALSMEAKPHVGEAMEFQWLGRSDRGLDRLPGQATHEGNEIEVMLPGSMPLKGHIIEASAGQLVIVDKAGDYHQVRLERDNFAGAWVRTPTHPKFREPFDVLKVRWRIKEAKTLLDFYLENDPSEAPRAAKDLARALEGLEGKLDYYRRTGEKP